jgi:hypothetical protein
MAASTRRLTSLLGAEIELGDDLVDVALHRALGDDEHLGGGSVAAPFGDQGEDLPLARVSAVSFPSPWDPWTPSNVSTMRASTTDPPAATSLIARLSSPRVFTRSLTR